MARLTLDSPANRNALSSGLIAQLLSALHAAVTDESVRVVLIDHTGPVFCSGADLRETAAATAGGTPGGTPGSALPAGRLGELLLAVWGCPKPVVARIGGPVRAGGLGLVAAADIAVCAATATFAATEVRLGVVPAVISATVLRRLSPRAAAELYLTGEVIGGDRAAQIGLVTAAVPADELDDAVAGYLSGLIRGAPGALAATKQLLHAQQPADLADALVTLTELSVQHFGSPEGIEGISAYRDKRNPSWIPRG